jgi:hypothetical protein
MLKKLVNQVMEGSLTTTISDTKSDKKLIKIKSVSVDGAYDSNRNFQYLQEKGITPGKLSVYFFINILHSSTASIEMNLAL